MGPKAVQKDNLQKQYQPPANDNLHHMMKELVPEEYRGTDQYLDVVNWNIRWFHDKDPERVNQIADVLAQLNADLFVFEEIAQGSMDTVARVLADRGAGYYKTAYGTTGGDQRVVFMYDLDWLRMKEDVQELFADKAYVTKDRKKIFPRLPLLGFFTCFTQVGDPFDFQLVGLHLKSQMGDGSTQRRMAAEKLCDWLETDAPRVDADVIMLGDFNENPAAAAWEPFRQLEAAQKAVFTSLNDKSNISHLMYRNKQAYGSRLDLANISTAAAHELKDKPHAIYWSALSDLLARNPSCKEMKNYITEIGHTISDHLPVITRFYYQEQAEGAKPSAKKAKAAKKGQ